MFRTEYTDASNSVHVEVETFCHRRLRNISAYRINILALRDVSVGLSPRLSIANCRPVPIASIADMPERAVGWRLNWGDANAVADQALELSNLSDNLTVVKSIDDNSIGFHINAKLKADETANLDAIIGVAWAPIRHLKFLPALRKARRQEYAGLRRSHTRAMEMLWEGVEVSVSDPLLERKIKASLFYILCGYRDDVVFGGTATGASSKGCWGGSVFWDTEFYLFPALLVFFPRLARNTLLYRHATLPAALANARSHGEAGARFAWQSKCTGKPFGGAFEDERHVTTDIAYAAWWYGRATNDTAFRDTIGTELILAAARNVASRLSFDEALHRYEFHGVIPPDEHVFDHYIGKPINNSAMTNAYAKWVLATASDLLPPGESVERRRWQTMADLLYQPRDPASGIIPEYDGYNGHPIKQADVAHLFFPLCETFDPDTVRKNVYYYADRERETGLFLTHSPSVYAAAASKIGDVRGVERFLELAGRNGVGPFDVPPRIRLRRHARRHGAGSVY